MDKRTTVVIVGGGLTVMVLILSVRHRNDVFAKRAHAAYQTQIRALAAEGVPTSLTLLQGPKPAPALDAGPIYQQIADQVKVSPLSKADAVVTDGFPASQIPSPTQFTAMHTALRRQARLMALVHAAAGRPRCDMGIDWSKPNPADIESPRFATIRMAARALSLESFDLAREGHMREAVQNQALGFRLADQADSGKVSMASLVAIAIDAITLEGMRKILYLSHGDPVIANAVANAIHKQMHAIHLSDTLKTEITYAVSEIEFLRNDGAQSLTDTVNFDASMRVQQYALRRISSSVWSAYLDDNGALMLATLRRNRTLIDQPYPAAYPQLLLSDAALEKEMGPSGNTRYIVARLLQNVDAKFASKKAMIEARAAIVTTSARLLIEKSKTGQFPASLSALSGALPDPFTGRPLEYRREGAGFVLYSVGEDGSFDGGSPNEKPKPGEYLFRYPMPAYFNEPAKE